MNKKRGLQSGLFFFAGMLAWSLSRAEPLPLWEIGGGLVAVSVPDYRGSDVSNERVLPIPYFVYRGKYLRADRDGVRGLLLESEHVKVNLSVQLGLGGKSADNPAREGMRDLKPMAEVGPTINVGLWQSTDERMKLEWRMPFRAGFTVESSPELIGGQFSPNLKFAVREPVGMPGWGVAVQAGPVFNTRRYNAHLYSVRPGEATFARPGYTASGGYAGSQVTFSASRRFPRYFVGAFIRYDALAGAVFEDSPLVKRKNAVAAGVAVAWILGESSTKVADIE